MNGFPLDRRTRIVAAAAVLSFAFAAWPTPIRAQASITYSPPDEFAGFVSADGATIVGADRTEIEPGWFTFSSFVIKNGVKTPLTLGGGYGFPVGVSADGNTVAGFEYDANFRPRLWIWHDGDAGASPLLPEIAGIPWGLSADGTTIVAYREDGFDAHAFSYRNGVYTELSYPGAFSTLPYGGVSDDGSVSGGIVYAETQWQKPIVWDVAGNPTIVPFSGFASQVDTVSSDGSAVAGIGWVWRIGDPSTSPLSFAPQFNNPQAFSYDGSILVGSNEPSFGIGTAYVWKNGVESVLQPPAGYENAVAFSVSADGFRIFGAAWNDDPNVRDAVVWQGDEGPQLLKDMLAAQGVTLGTQRLNQAYSSNPDGTVILGNAVDLDSTYQTFIAVLPLPPTPPEMVQNLIVKVEGAGLPNGVETSLVAKLIAALDALEQGDLATATNKLTDFISQVNALSGVLIPPALAEELIADAEAILEKLAS